MPYTTLSHHKLIYNDKEKETVTFNVDDFYESLVQGINMFNRNKANGKTVKTEEVPIMIESYANLASMVFNQSHLGFNRDRGGVSFWGQGHHNMWPSGKVSVHIEWTADADGTCISQP